VSLREDKPAKNTCSFLYVKYLYLSSFRIQE